MEFHCGVEQIDQIDWHAIVANDWRAPEIKERKQAEFLVHRSFPWELVSRVGVRSGLIRAQVADALVLTHHKPKIEIRPEWYY